MARRDDRHVHDNGRRPKPDTRFIATNFRLWLEATGMRLADVDRGVQEHWPDMTGHTMAKQIHRGESPGSIEVLLAIAHELGLKLQDLVAEPVDTPRELVRFLDEHRVEESITDEEIRILKGLHVPRRRMNARAYGYALDMIRKAEKSGDDDGREGGASS